MDPFQALAKLPDLVADYERVTSELIAAQRELAALRDDGYVNWAWVCAYLDVDQKTARLMLAEVKILAYGRKVKKFRRSDIIRFAEKHSIRVRDLTVRDLNG